MKLISNRTISNFISKLSQQALPSQEAIFRIDAAISFIAWLASTEAVSANDASRFRNELLNAKHTYKTVLSKVSFPLTYVGIGLGLISLLLIGTGIYLRFYKNVQTPFAYSPTSVRAGRSISFQGRMTDTLGNPITAPIDVTYNFYTVATGGSPIASSTRVCTASPDQDGVFNSLIGNDSGPSCNTELPSSVFSENANVYLGVTIGTEITEMTPRQQIANVGYAINAEALQGMPPGQGVSNIPFINQDGNMLIAAANPGLRSTFASSNFTISSAQATTIQSAGSGDITLSATEGGSLRFKVYNGSLAEQMTILNTGNVGIGNTNPSLYKFDVSGTGRFTGTVVGADAVLSTEFATLGQIAAGAGQYFQRTLGSLAPTNITDDINVGAVATGSAMVHLPGLTNKNAFFNLGTGNVGIGTTAPTMGKLQITGGNIQLDSGNASTRGLGWGFNDGTDHTNLANIYSIPTGSYGADLNFDVTGSGGGTYRRMRLTYSGGLSIGNTFTATDPGANNVIIEGNVGIGTTAPSNELEVNGDIELTNLYDNDASNFFDGGCSATTTITGIDSTGAITCTAISGVPASSVAFSGITSGTNTIAAMLVGAGASLDYTSTGTINASSLVGATWVAPGTIGSTTPNTGAFTTLSSTLGANFATTSGNVGIGTTSPAYKLDIVGNSALWQSVYPSDDGLVLSMPFSEGTGTKAYDKSPKGNDGTLSGTYTWSTGKYGNGLSFTSGQVTTGYTPQSGAKSLSYWVYYNTVSTGDYQLMGTQEGTDKYFYNGIQNGGQGYSYAGDTGGTYNYTFSAGQWYQVSMTMEETGAGAGTTHFYVNGVQVDTRSYASSSNSTLPFWIGKLNPSGYPFNAKIDEIHVYNRTLSADEIKTQYLQGMQSQGYVMADNFKIINTSASELLRVTNSGNVGIGTTAPGAKLDIYGAGLSAFTGTTRGILSLNTPYSGSTTTALDFLYSGNNYPVARIGAYTTGSGTYLQFGTSNNYAAGVTNTAMSIDYSGLVGIGTTGPTTALDVNGQVRVRTLSGTATSALCYDGSNILTPCASSSSITGTGVANYVARWTSATNLSTGVLYDDGTNVGIGTTNPTSMLQIQNSSNRSIDNYSPLSTDGNGANLIWSTNTTGSTKADVAYFGAVQDGATQQSGRFYWQVSNAGAPGIVMTLNKSGNLGIGAGVVVPLSKLGVVGNVSVGATYGTIAAPTSGMIIEGNVGIGTTGPLSKVQVNLASGVTGTVDEYADLVGASRFTLGVVSGLDDKVGLGAAFASAGESIPAGFVLGRQGTSWGTFVAIHTHPNDAVDIDAYPERMRIDMSGNVGIGTTAPSSMLSVGASSQFQVNSTGNIVKLNNVTTSFPGSQGAANSFLRNDGAGALTWADPTGTGVSGFWQRNGTNLAPTNIGDNVGIGTTGPGSLLHVYQTGAVVNGAAKFDGTGSSSTGNFSVQIIKKTGATNANVEFWEGGTQDWVMGTGITATDANFRLYSGLGVAPITVEKAGAIANTLYLKSGNVGIGTTSPGGLLTLNAAADTSLALRVTQNNIFKAAFAVEGTVPTYYTNAASGDLIIASGGNIRIGSSASTGEKLFINTTSGNVGIGTTGPTEKLHIASGQVLTDSATNISYAAGDNLIYGDDPEYSVQDDATDANYKLMKTFRAGKSGTLRVKWQAYIQSGTYWWAYKIAKNNEATTLSSGSYATCDDGVCGVHGYEQFTDDVSGVDANDTIELWMVSSTSGGTPVNGNGQYLYAKEFRMYSGSPSVEWVANNIWGANVGIGTTAPSSMLSVGASSQFQVNSTGNIVKLNNVTTSFPGSQGAANSFLRNDGAGALTWADPTGTGVSGFWQRNGTNLAPTNIGDNVGIGTTAPGAKLEVVGTSIIGNGANSSTSIPLTLRGLAVSDGSNPYGDYAGMLFSASSGYTAGARRYLITNALGINKFGIIRSVDSTTNPTLGTAGAITSGTADFVIDNAGNVGIGTTGPTQKLHVHSTGANTLRLSGGTTNSNPEINLDSGTEYDGWQVRKESATLWGIKSVTSGNDMALFVDNTNTRGVYIKTGGNVGIGTTNPLQPLHVYSTGALTAINIENKKGSAGGTSAVMFGLSDGAFVTNDAARVEARIVGNPNAALDFKTYHSSLQTDMTIYNGNVGIGTTNPGYKLHVVGDAGAMINEGTNLNIRMTAQGGQTALQAVNDAANAFVPFRVDGSTLLLNAQSLGNVGIGTTGPTTALDVNGQVRVRTLSGTATSALCYDGSNVLTPCASSSSLTGTGVANYVARWTSATNLSTGVLYDNGTNVGIGTTGPGYKLDVVGTERISSYIASEKNYSSLDDGLILNYPFSEGTGSIAHDRSKTGADATLTSTTWADGKIGKTVSFDDTSGANAEVPANTAFNFGTGDWSISTWVYPTAINLCDTVFAQDSPYTILRVYCSDATKWEIYNNNIQYVGPVHGMSVNKWYFLTLTRSSNTFTLYQNGISIWSFGVSTNPTNLGNATWRIGNSSWASTTEMWSKYIDEFRVYNRAITADEIRMLYDQGLGTQAPYTNIVNGNVGIGTTGPGAKLQVDQAATNDTVGAKIGNGYNVNSVLNGSFGTNGKVGLIGSAYYSAIANLPTNPLGTQYATAGVVGIGAGTSGSAYGIGVAGFGQSVTNATGLTAGGKFSATANGALNAADNLYGVYSVGDGTANTTGADSVYGTYSSALGAGSDITYGGYFTGSGGTTNYGVYSAAGTNYFNGNVGIGTTGPSAKLHVISDAAGQGPLTNFVAESSVGNASIAIKGLSTSNYAYQTFYQGSTGKMELGIVPTTADFYINPNVQVGATGAALYIQKASGNVGIGTTAPALSGSVTQTRVLEVDGQIRSGSGGQGTNGDGLFAAGASGGYFSAANWNGNVLMGWNLYSHSTGNTTSYRTPAAYSGYAGVEGYAGGIIKFYTASATQTAGADITPSEKMRIDAAGNVGIGTTGPLSKLHVFGSGSEAFARFDNSNAANYGLIKFAENGTGKGYLGMGGSTQAFGANAAYAQDGFSMNSDGVGVMNISNRGTSKTIYLNTGTEEAADFHTVTVKSGNVGIGTTGPANTLQIGSMGSSGYAGNDFTIGNGTQVFAIDQTAGGPILYTNTNFSFMPSGAGSTGNVGIGIASPQYKLHVNATTTIPNARTLNFYPTGEIYPVNTFLTVGQAADNAATTAPTAIGVLVNNDSSTDNTFSPLIGWGNKSNSAQYSQLSAGIAGRRTTQGLDPNWHGGELHFYTGSRTSYGLLDRMTINDSGLVGIGTTGPTTALDVNGQVRVRTLSGTATSALCYDGSGILTPCASSSSLTGTGIANYVARWTSATNLSTGVLYDNGTNVGIGTTGPGTKLDVRGDDYRLSNATVTKEFSVTFPNAVANQKVDFYMTGTQSFWGTLEVTVTDLYSNQNASGLIKKVYGLGLNPAGSIYTNEARYTEVLGVTADNWALSDVSWDATNSRYKITLVHRVSTGNVPRISIKAFGVTSGQVDNAATFTVGSIYTTDATVYGRPYEHFNNNVGIGTTGPNAKLHVTSDLANPTVFQNANYGQMHIANTSGSASNFDKITFGNPYSSSVSQAAIGVRFESNGTYMSLGTSNNYGLGVTNTALTIDPSGNLSTGLINDQTISSAADFTGTITAAGAIQAPNFRDATGAYNVNLGSGGSEGRGLVAGYSGGSYGGIGYNIRHTATGGTYIAPGADTVSYILFTGGGFTFQGAAGGTAGRTPTMTNLMSIAASGAVTGGTYNDQDIDSVANFTGSLTVAGETYLNGTVLEGDSKTMLRYSDTYLRLNEDVDFTAGIWMGNSNLLAGSGYWGIGSNGGTTTASTYLVGAYTGTNLIKIDSSSSSAVSYFNAGNVGIGTTNPSSFKLQVAGNVGPNADNSYDLGSASLQWRNLYVSGTIAQGGYLNPNGDSMLFNGDFELGTNGWNGGTAITTDQYAGGKSLQVTGSFFLESSDYIPVDPTRDVIQLEAYVKKSVAGTTPGVLYFGYWAYDKNKTIITTSPCGTYCYFATAGWTIPVDSAWHKVSATRTGEGTGDPNFPVGTKFIRVLGLVNYGGSGDTVTLIDHVSVKKINNGPLFVGNNFSSTNMVDQYQSTKLYTNSSNHFYVEPPTNGNIILNTSGTGNVGIGTTGPRGKLDVNSTSPIYLQSHATYWLKILGGDVLQAENTSGYSMLNLNYYGGGVSLAVNGGNVGIGTTGPVHKLEVVGSTTWDDTAKFVSTGTSTGLELYTSTTTRNGVVYGDGTNFGLLSADTGWVVRVSNTDAQIYHALTADSSVTITGTLDPNGAVTLPTTGISGAGTGSGLDADLLDGQHGSYYLPISSVVGKTITYDGDMGPSSSLYTVNSLPVGGFGQLTGHGDYANFNTEPAVWGWSYVIGTTNAPHTGAQGGYRSRIGLGSEYSSYGMELNIPRSSSGGNGVGYLFMRQMEGASWGSWAKISAGYADTTGSANSVAYANITGIPTRTAWSGVHRGFVAEQLSWKNYGNNHTIFDASASTSPEGGAVNNTDSAVAWTATYPTLMGWNGASTYGVRVDSARLADIASSVNFNGGLTTGSGPTFADVYVNGWFRNNAQDTGLYNQELGMHFYAAGPNYWHINNAGSTTGGLILYDQHNPTQGGATGRKGYLYFDPNGFGLLDSGGSWAVRTTPTNTEIGPYSAGLNVNSSGSVGIGTTGPGANLDVYAALPVVRISTSYASAPYTAALDLGYQSSATSKLRIAYTANDAVSYIDNVYQTTATGQPYGDIHLRTYPTGGSSAVSAITVKGYTGNVGIGTTGPSQKLDVNGNTVIYATDGNQLRLQSTNGAGGAGTIGIEFGNSQTAPGGEVAGWNQMSYLQTVNYNMTLKTNSTGNIILSPGGNVGIGTAGPVAKLDVNGDISLAYNSGATNHYMVRSYAAAHVAGDVPNNTYLGITDGPGYSAGTFAGMQVVGVRDGGGVYNDYSLNFNTHDGGVSAGTRMVIAAGGNVGIGTTGPIIKLAIGDTDTGLNWTADGTLDLYSNNVNTLSVRTGNVGIGTTAPGTIFQVGTVTQGGLAYDRGSGTVYVGGDNSQAGSINIKNSSSTTNVLLNSNGDSYFNGGSLGIGNTTPAVKLQVGSTSMADGSSLIRLQDTNSSCDFTAQTGSPSCGSDITLKKDVESMNRNLDKVLGLRPVTYRWKTDEDFANLQYGFIAQEVATLMPELVTENTWIDGTQRKFLQTGGMIPYIVGAIKEQQSQLTALSTQLATMSLSSTGTLVIEPSGNISDIYQVRNSTTGSIIDTVGAFAEIAVAKLRAGFVEAENIVAKKITSYELQVTNLLVAGKSINQLIDERIQLILNSQIISPIAESEKIITNEIKPVNNDLVINLSHPERSEGSSGNANASLDSSPLAQNDKGELAKLIIQGINNATVASIDAEGNASFSGQLIADSVVASSSSFLSSSIYHLSSTEASISGTLIAKNIESENIKSLEERVGVIASEAKQSQNEIASVPTMLSGLRDDMSSHINAIQQELADLKNQPLANPAYYQNIDASYDNLTVNDTANIYKAHIADSLVVGSLFIQPSSILALSADLRISSLGTIRLFDDVVIISKNGDIAIKGAVSATSLAIKNTDGITVASIDASGSARFNEVLAKKFTLESIATQGALIADSGVNNEANIPIPAIKTNAEIAGIGSLPQDAKEVIVYNDNVTANSLIYLTPTTPDIQGQLSVTKKISCAGDDTRAGTRPAPTGCVPYFVVSTNANIHSESSFNWLIIN